MKVEVHRATDSICAPVSGGWDEHRGRMPKVGNLGSDVLSLWTALPMQDDFDLIAAGELARDQPDPGSKMPSVFELRFVADGRNDCRGRLRADALDGGDALAWLTFEEYSIDLLVERGDTPIKVSEEIVKL